jgi:hypothetical protein
MHADPVDIDLHHHLKTIEAADDRDCAIEREMEHLTKRGPEHFAKLVQHYVDKKHPEVCAAFGALLWAIAEAELDEFEADAADAWGDDE